MMGDTLPIRFVEQTQLSKHGIRPASIKFSTVTLESEGRVCVAERPGELVVVALGDCPRTDRHQVPGDMALLGTGVAAVRRSLDTNTALEMYDGELKVRLKSHTLRGEVVFWRWLCGRTLGVVTPTAVWHWPLEGDAAPLRVFDRLPAMAGFQVVDYRADPRLGWLVLAGLAAEGDRVLGKLQLFSAERGCSQLIEGHAACFARLRTHAEEATLLCFTSAGQHTKLHLVEVGARGDRPLAKRSVDVFLPSEAPSDFPVAMQSGSKHGVLYLITKYGYLYIYDLEMATCIYVNRISAETIFVTAPHESTGGIIGVNRRGQVLSVSIDEAQIIPYIKNVLKNTDLALLFASRNNLPGAEESFVEKFNLLFENKEYTEAAKLAAIAPGGILRTPQTIQKFQQAKASCPGQVSPLLQYFGTLLDYGQLNKEESLEICRPVLLQGKKELLEKWLMQNKLECSEELGNLVKNVDSNLALSVYLRASVPNKVVECFAESGHFEKILFYSEKVNYNPDYIYLLKNTISTNPDKGLEFAKVLLRNGKPIVDLHLIVDAFIERSLVQQCTAFLLEALKNNLPSEGDLQTQLLEMNLLYAPQVADAILGNRMFSHYDRGHVGRMCEKAGLVSRALEHFSQLEDLRRVVVRTDSLETDWVLAFFGTLSVGDSVECLRALLSTNSKRNLNLCIQIAVKYYKQLTTNAIIDLFESFKSTDGIFCFLGAIIKECQDEEVHFKYIKAACELGQIGVAESICRNSNYYCPEKVKNYLKEAKITDYLPLLVVCDRFNFLQDLVFFLHTNKLNKYIEIYVKNVNPNRLPAVVGELLDLDSSEGFIQKLIQEVEGSYSSEELVLEVEKRNRLYLLLNWLEEKARKGCNEACIHNALGKIYIDMNSNPENYLKENRLYDSLVVGKYCEAINPHLACIAYERGNCDLELLQVYRENSMFKQAAKFLVRRKDQDLWERVLHADDVFRKSLVDQVSSSLLESRDPAEVSACVKAFMAVQLLSELIHILDTLLSENTTFSEEPNLQNLIILTAMKVEKSKVMEFIKRFNNYAAEEIANIAVNSELYDEALAIYKKFSMNDLAMDVLMKYLNNVEEGQEFAENCDDATVWNSLGQAQLHRGLVKDAIASFLKAENPSSCEEVVKAAQVAEEWEDLLRYLQMVAKKSRDPFTESELLYAYAKTGRLRELEEFISVPNNAEINKIGDRCFEFQLYEAAKLLYNNSSNFSNLAITQLCLKEFQGAVENARKANKIQTWKKVCFSCIENKEFRFAQMCALHIVVNAEELEALIAYYEDRGFFEELISALEVALTQERAHMGMFTHLAILYCKYRPERLREHLELFWSRVSVAKVVRAAEEAHLWQELVFLHDKYEQHDKALEVMMAHPTEAWREGLFGELALRVSSHQLHLEAVQFHLRYRPLQLDSFLRTLAPKLDNHRVVAYLSEVGRLELVKPYLRSVQHLNDRAINEALNGLLVAEGEYQGLRVSIDSYDNFDAGALARRLEAAELVELRRLAGVLLCRLGRWAEALELCRQNGLLADAVRAAADSRSPELAEGLAEWFLAADRRQWFAATLLACYHLLRPDVVLELAWRHAALHLAVPFMVQVLREYVLKVDSLHQARLTPPDQEDPPEPARSITSHRAFGFNEPSYQTYK